MPRTLLLRFTITLAAALTALWLAGPVEASAPATEAGQGSKAALQAGEGMLAAAPAAARGRAGWPGELPEEVLSRAYLVLEARDVSQAEAERVMSRGVAAVYLPDARTVRVLVEQTAFPAVAAAMAASRTATGYGGADSRLRALGVGTLRDFAAQAVAEATPAAAGHGTQYLVKLPAVTRLAAPLATPRVATAAAADGIVMTEGFEGDTWARWQRYPSSPAYTWEVSTCESHSGTRSGDAVRGGTSGSQLACDADHPPAMNNWIVDGTCEVLPAAAGGAWLDAYVHVKTSNPGAGAAPDDYLAFYYGPDASGYWWGWAFWGSFDAWSHVVMSLQQWYYFGDLGFWECPQLAVVFVSDGSGQDGFGARVDDITIRTGSAPFLTCAIETDQVSGIAPATVRFSAVVAGATGEPSYSWGFGDKDGSTGTGQQASFTYLEPGDYDPTLTVDAGGERCLASVYFPVDPGCTLACSATVPATGQAGTAVSFQGSATPSDCGGAVTYAWSFGDTATSGEQNPSHVYAGGGSYGWEMTALVGDVTCQKSGTITISGGVEQLTYTISSQAHLPGAGGTQWRSNVAAVNRTGSTANLTLTYFPYSSGAAPVVKNAAVGAGATVEWPDILAGLFGQSGSPKGSVQVASDQPLYLVARTFNQAATGTYGQYYPAVTGAQALGTAAAGTHALAAGQVGVLPMLKKNAAFRTNVGILNVGDAAVTALVKLFSAAGIQVGSSKSLTASPSRYIQQDDIFANVGAGTQDIAYATVEVQTAGGKIWAYASVVDAATGDPTTVPVIVQ